MRICLKIKVKSLNKDRYSHWGKRSNFSHKQRELAATAIANNICVGALKYTPYNTVVLTRFFNGKAFDNDNLIGSFKAIRDGICDALGVNDGSANIKWLIEQVKCKQNDYILIEIEQYDTLKACEMDFTAKKMAKRSFCSL